MESRKVLHERRGDLKNELDLFLDYRIIVFHVGVVVLRVVVNEFDKHVCKLW